MLFSEVLELWWIGNQLNLREITRIHKRQTIEKHILPWFGETNIEDIDDILINGFITHERKNGNRISEGGICENTIIKELGIIKGVIEYAIKKEYICFNPFELVPNLKRTRPKEFNVYTFDEVQKLIVAARPKWLGDMILLAYNTGMRKSECFGLQWDDINFENKALCIRRGVTATKPNERLISEPKTSTSIRTIMLDNDTINMLKRRFTNRTSDIWIFADKYGKLISPWYNVRYFRKSCTEANIPPRRFYDLRHTHITDLVTNGIALPIIQKRAGHSNISMTMHYTHVDYSMQQSTVDFLNNRNRE